MTSADGTRLSVQVDGSGPPLVMVDPAGAFSGMRPLDDAIGLLSRDLTVVTFDRRGRGRSTETPPYSVRREVEDIEAVVGLTDGPPTLFGFSSGAALAMHAATQVPVCRLVLLEPAVDLDGSPDTDFTDDLARLISDDRRGEAIEYFQRAIGVPDDWVRSLRSHPAWEGLEDLAHTLLYDAAVTDSLTREVLSRIEVPAVVMLSEGTGSPLREWSESAAAAIPRGSVCRLPGEWHTVPAEVLTGAILRAVAD